jgi:peptide/nickel transport system permease protein
VLSNLPSYIGHRVLQAVPVLIGVSLASFLLIHVVGGNPAAILLGPHATPKAVAALDRQYGLDRPLVLQYLSFLRGAFVFSFGNSIVDRTAVRGLILGRASVTWWLLVYGTLIATVLAIPLAFWSAIKRNRVPDHGVRLFSMITLAMPAFWLGLLLALLFGLRLGWFPTAGYEPGLVGHVKSLTLPALTIGLYLAPMLIRTLRSSVLEVLSQEYVEAARARGVGEFRLMAGHVFKNAVPATLSVLGVQVAFLFAGAVVVEQVFALPGLGSLLVNSVIARDFPVITALTLVIGVSVVLVNLAVDLLYAVLDPRIRLSGR